MGSIGAAWARLAAQVDGMRPQLRLCLRITVAAMLTFSISELLKLPWPLWAVLTAVIVTQMSVGKSLKATLDYMEGTLGGAIYSGLVGAVLPHTTNLQITVALGVAVAPLSLLATKSPRFAAAPFTAVMVLLLPTMTHAGSAAASAFYRVIEVAVGCVTSLAVSFLVLPERAHNLVIDGAVQMLQLMARVLPELLAGFTEGREPSEARRQQAAIGQAFIRLDGVAAEAKRERMAYFNAEPDAQPLVTNMLRLRHDLVMLGRAGVQPLPPAFTSRLAGAINDVGAAAVNFLQGSATALADRTPPPSLAAFETSLDAYSGAFAAARRDGLTRALSAEAAEHLFALGFIFEQLHQNLRDLSRSVDNHAQPAAGKNDAADRRPFLKRLF